MQKVKQLIKRPEFIVISLIIILRVLYYICLDYTLTPDSYEYIARDGFAWLHGAVDRYRLPVYPMIIDVCKYVSESHYTLLLCLFQFIVSLFSVIVLYWTIRKITEKKWICLFVTFIYGTLLAVAGWDKTLLTESLSLSLTVFVLFGIVSFIKEHRYSHVIITTICLLIGCFLRAVFVIYLGLFFGFLILTVIFPSVGTKDPSRKRNVKCALITSIPIVLVLLYAFAFHNQFGGFTLSDSALGQQLYVVLQNDYYKESSDTELTEIADSILNNTAGSTLEKKLNKFIDSYYSNPDDPEILELKEYMLTLCDNRLSEEIEANLEELIYEEYQNHYKCSFANSIYLARLYIMENYDRSRVEQFVDESKSNHLKQNLIRIPLNVLDSYSCYLTTKSSPRSLSILSALFNNSLFFINITVVHSLIVSVVELLAFVVIRIKKKKTEWIRLGLGALILSTILLSIFGTNGDFARTAITCLPCMFAAVALHIDWFSARIIQRRADR